MILLLLKEKTIESLYLPYFQSVQLYSPDRKAWNVYYYDKEEQNSMKEQLLSIGVMEEKICMKNANEFWN